MMNITLRQMRYFETLARLGHFGRAADLCAITQPALSLQIKELEETLAAPLFERGPRPLRLTGFGEVFLERVQAILRQVDELGDLVRHARGSMAGRLRLGVIPTIAPYVLPRIIGQLTQSYPGLDLVLRETITPKLLQELLDGQLDCAIVALPVSEPSLAEMALVAENFVLVRPLADAAAPVPNRDMLREMRLLLLEEGHCFRDQALSFCTQPSKRPREVLDGSSLATLVQMVGAGIGVTLIPEMAVGVETRSAPVAVARFPDPQPSRTIGMVWRKTSPLIDDLRRVAQIVGDCTRAAIGPLPDQ